MKNEHLVPVLVLDLVSKLNATKNENEKMNYAMRLEAIVECCTDALEVYRKKNYLNDAWKQRGSGRTK